VTGAQWAAGLALAVGTVAAAIACRRLAHGAAPHITATTRAHDSTWTLDFAADATDRQISEFADALAGQGRTVVADGHTLTVGKLRRAQGPQC
jgi:hypothetical protein